MFHRNPCRMVMKIAAGLLVIFLLAGSNSFSPQMTLVLLGDVMLGRGVAEAHTGGDWENTFSELTPLLNAADLTGANLESPIKVDGQDVPEESETGYNLCAPGEALAAFTGIGLDVLSTVNNHANDCGDASASRETLQSAGFMVLVPDEIAWQNYGGLKLAWIALEDVTKALDLDAAVVQIRQAKAAGAVVIVSVHWGLEYHSFPSDRQRQAGEALAAAGADVIWGHHPHVLQPIEEIPNPDGRHSTLVAYSLGNALFDQVVPAGTRKSVVLQVRLDAAGVVDYLTVPIRSNPFTGTVEVGE